MTRRLSRPDFQNLYGRYIAQVISNNMRVDIVKNTPGITLTDTRWAPWSTDSTSTLSSRTKVLRQDHTPQQKTQAVLKQIGAGGHQDSPE